VIDLAVVLLPALRPIRVARSARALRLLRASRAGAAIARGARKTREALTQHGLHYAITVAMLATVGGAFITYAVEKDAAGSNIHTIGDALWWAVTTVATVGYGDRYPVTP